LNEGLKSKNEPAEEYYDEEEEGFEDFDANELLDFSDY